MAAVPLETPMASPPTATHKERKRCRLGAKEKNRSSPAVGLRRKKKDPKKKMVPHLHIRQCVCVCVEEATLASLGKSGHFHIKTCLADDVRGCAKGRPRPAVVQKKNTK